MTKWVYSFNQSETEGGRELRDLLGGKGANLAEMCSLGLPVPPGFTITTEACIDYQKQADINNDIKLQVKTALENIEKLLEKKFGDEKNPLLFSVRSGARVSMPGMMDTVLNLGLNDKTVLGLAKLTENERFAWDSYRRFIQMYSNVVLGVNGSLFEATLEDLKEARNVKEDTELSADDFKELVEVYKIMLVQESGKTFPQDPFDQLWHAVTAVFKSWNNPRAIKYRELNNIADSWGTAVNVQSMVFGNMGEDSGTGVCFSRDPSTGAKRFFGEYLMNAQGEDVVAGIRTPAPINEDSKNIGNEKFKTLEEVAPKVFAELTTVYQNLEKHYKDMQDIEFTIEKGKLFILQTRNGKRTTAAAIKIAVDLVSEGLLTEKEALLKIDPKEINQLLHPRLDPNASKTLLTKGLSASPGAATGKIYFSSEEAVKNEGESLLVRQETSPEDIAGMAAANGILTARGGMTSHAAVVARGMGKPCVAGCSHLDINYNEKKLTVDGKTYFEGDYLTIDGASGEVYEGRIETLDPVMSKEFELFMTWADSHRKLGIRANADNPRDAETALSFGAEGIGLCRTEHMFFEGERILAIREMIFSTDATERKRALDKLLPFQKEDFVGLLTAMSGKPVNIRLLDPPLHEFLPHTEYERKELAEALGVEIHIINSRIDSLHEFNPMLGHRGCRLGLSYPEIYRMQTKAIMEAALECKKKGIEVNLEIMIPLIAVASELKELRLELEDEIKNILGEEKVNHKIGTMIELPRAAITASEVSEYADFFSYGTNDLTQTTLGLSRDDSGKFLSSYVAKGILKQDPFVSIDQSGVGFLVKHSVSQVQRDGFSHGICGEHGGDPESIQFCHDTGLNYVSCSPFRVPIARLAAAQAAIR